MQFVNFKLPSLSRDGDYVKYNVSKTSVLSIFIRRRRKKDWSLRNWKTRQLSENGQPQRFSYFWCLGKINLKGFQKRLRMGNMTNFRTLKASSVFVKLTPNKFQILINIIMFVIITLQILVTTIIIIIVAIILVIIISALDCP